MQRDLSEKNSRFKYEKGSYSYAGSIYFRQKIRYRSCIVYIMAVYSLGIVGQTILVLLFKVYHMGLLRTFRHNLITFQKKVSGNLTREITCSLNGKKRIGAIWCKSIYYSNPFPTL